ncbi:MAG: sigma factor G inhibitor Gin [Syntrophaceticus sp.]|nr:inhibitor of sigma-G Gin [Syntrophomonadaceae bacterium]
MTSRRIKGVLLPICLICEETPPRGIAGGIMVSGSFLCMRCEKEIVRTRVGDSRYFDLKEKIKRIWYHEL